MSTPDIYELMLMDVRAKAHRQLSTAEQNSASALLGIHQTLEDMNSRDFALNPDAASIENSSGCSLGVRALSLKPENMNPRPTSLIYPFPISDITRLNSFQLQHGFKKEGKQNKIFECMSQSLEKLQRDLVLNHNKAALKVPREESFNSTNKANEEMSVFTSTGRVLNSEVEPQSSKKTETVFSKRDKAPCAGSTDTKTPFMNEEPKAEKPTEIRKLTKQKPTSKSSKSSKSSKYRGVFWNRRSNCWQARIMINGKSYHLGFFEKENEAALAYDCRARECGVKKRVLNFSMKRKVTGLALASKRQKIVAEKVTSFKGVCWHKGIKKWKAALYLHGKYTHIGYFKLAQDAKFAHDTIAEKIRDKISSFTSNEEMRLQFDACIKDIRTALEIRQLHQTR